MEISSLLNVLGILVSLPNIAPQTPARSCPHAHLVLVVVPPEDDGDDVPAGGGPGHPGDPLGHLVHDDGHLHTLLPPGLGGQLVAGGGQLGAGLGLQLGLLLPRQGLAPGAALLLLGRLGQGPGVPGGLPLVVVVAAVHQHHHVHGAGVRAANVVKGCQACNQ